MKGTRILDLLFELFFQCDSDACTFHLPNRIPQTHFISEYLVILLLVDSVQSLSHAPLFATLWTAAHQASLSITNTRSSLKLMSIESVIPSNHLILCCPLLLLPSIFPSIRVFCDESVLRIGWPKYWSFSGASVLPVNIQDYFL